MALESSSIKLAELLRHPDDLEKITSLKLEYQRKKAVVDSQLKAGLKEQLDVTQLGMTGISEGQRGVQAIKDEMMKIDKLCAEAQNMIRDFPNINLVSQTHRNFSAVETMRANIEGFNERLDRVEVMLREDDADLANLPNLLNAHYELTNLRNIRDDALDQIARAEDASLQNTLEEYFQRLDGAIDWFDEHIGTVAVGLIEHLMDGNNGVVVRLALVIEAEERSDKRVRALQEALKDHKEMAARFRSITDGAKSVRGYKEKFLKAIEIAATSKLDASRAEVRDDVERIEKSFRWFFNDLNAVKQGMVPLMPKKWKILRTYGSIFHRLMHDYLIDFVDDPETSQEQLLGILSWPEKYYKKMAKLGFKQEELQPPVLDNRETELIQGFKTLIVKFLDQWLERIWASEQKDFAGRNVDGSNLEQDANDYFRTKNLVDMWRMLREQLDAASNSDRTDVAEGVVDAMIARLKTRQGLWQKMLDDEAAKYIGSKTEPDKEGFQPLQDWLIATANDQIACIDDNEEEGRYGYLQSFRQKFQSMVTPVYLESADNEISVLSDAYMDLSVHCISKFAQLVFAVDFKTVLADFFTPKWYAATAIQQMVYTFDEYLNDYKGVLHHSLLDILIEEMAVELLVHYMSAVRNKGAKFKRNDPYKDKIYQDISTVLEFFSNNQHLDPSVGASIREKWKVTELFLQLIEVDKASVPEVYAVFKTQYWDLQLSWVEAVLRARDDFDRGLLNALKARAAQVESTRGAETIMSKVK